MFQGVIKVNPLSYLIWVYQDIFYFGRIEHPWVLGHSLHDVDRIAHVRISRVSTIETLFRERVMSNNLVVDVKDLSLSYKMFKKPSDMIVESVLGGVRHDTFWALKDVSLEVREGQRLGLIGPNGAGKARCCRSSPAILRRPAARFP